MPDATSIEFNNPEKLGGQPLRVPLNSTDWRQTALVFLICVGVYVPVMGAYGMYDPWETHYTEVARQFMVRGDWLSTYWHNGTGPEGWAETNFWSKPVGSFWMSGLSLKLFGYGAATGEEIATGHIEWAVRLPFFLCTLFAVFCVYLMCARLFSRRAGVLAAAILATSPMFFMIGRQAMTDMAYVGPMSGGIALLILGLFGQEEILPQKSFKFGKRGISWPHAPCYYIFVGAFLLFMILQLTAIVGPLRKVPMPFSIGGKTLSAAIWMGIYGILALVLVWMSRKTKTRNEVYIYTFYLAVAVGGLAKGLIGALQPGMVILVYLLASREWRILTDVALTRGLMIAICIAFPWYHGMVARYGRGFWNEFFGTEQFRRLTIGEQSQAKGTFEFYIKQIGYGLYPWVAFLPAALVRVLTKMNEREPQERVRLFVGIWLFSTFALFALSVTKYNHYILPVIPPAAILVALWLDDLLEKKAPGVMVCLLVGVSVLLFVSIDLVVQPAHWVWMYTYLYDSNWAKGVPDGWQIPAYAIASGIILFLLFWPRARKLAVWSLVGITVVFGGYVLNWHQLGCSKHWSQKQVIANYYKMRKNPEEK
ncbi:MAG: glycosyltransferase family 39 protein, partial [Pseudomonadota bacterium]